MSHRSLPAVTLCAAAVMLGACGSDAKPTTSPSAAAAHPTGDVLLAVEDLPEGYATSPPDATPEVSAASSPSVEGCEALLDLFRGGGPTEARFEAGATGPFLAESLAAVKSLDTLAAKCQTFTDTDGDGATTSVRVETVGDFPRVGDSERVFRMSAQGGTGDDAFALSGYLVQLGVGGLTCTIVHFGQPGVDRGETESIARAAVTKIRRRQ
ncbi:hypothetical protein ACQP00_51700 [Dactylosporangium sp. CS-047395]|uniref:hypothetical protein n=1 Tax=Dactylosporangium sp. CS-047395 TaxID=3239936 RepID=UPI003D89BD13